eukprot:6492690-Amphidinium_carterae.1
MFERESGTAFITKSQQQLLVGVTSATFRPCLQFTGVCKGLRAPNVGKFETTTVTGGTCALSMRKFQPITGLRKEFLAWLSCCEQFLRVTTRA